MFQLYKETLRILTKSLRNRRQNRNVCVCWCVCFYFVSNLLQSSQGPEETILLTMKESFCVANHTESIQLSTHNAQPLTMESTFGKPLAGESKDSQHERVTPQNESPAKIYFTVQTSPQCNCSFEFCDFFYCQLTCTHVHRGGLFHEDIA